MVSRRILLIVGGGIAAYKACELIRALRKAGHSVRCVLTDGGAHFVTPMTLAALSEQPVHTSLWDLKDEAEMGHIQLSRQADLVVVCPATADLLARMAAGIADDLATTLLLATDTPVLAVPAMNVRMWLHPATRRNVATLRADGVTVMEPDEGAMACGEYGPGRLPEVEAIVARIEAALGTRPSTSLGTNGASVAKPSPLDPFVPSEVEGREARPPLTGKHALVTAGPTHEPIDPVRYIANRSSGKQGYAIAAALAALGARVTLVSGPVALATPPGVTRIDVETAREMAAAVETALPADIAVMVAAVADWRVEAAGQKIKKGAAGTPALTLVENPDILATLAASPRRPTLLIGFAAETEHVADHAQAKLARKGCDWIVANDVSGDVMGGDTNSVRIVTRDGIEEWPAAAKADVAARLARRIADALA
ncbi:bifunctional phosphopantothenoylcysteine decarboxylase/phosphopantothenate synthase [Sphingomonas naphthae]|uniref:Coenzyme A biosynthesis bifunctional protein CoaBC n=1 Tax=Sphingomonas naphthae TaxID=1813468 RepID=A0ABY7TG79_9SPHN|nr:bifunctional phosphopantothenoylcysteine decarboxylase/phosphopantothenate synthase [Sphingomonas naphthae]WCT71940.1 bifunctional phosphopantothenoylcysteine decarboxylase/phosphopantothenate synthase [Sphingomonas naphthae]